ncbi:MAG: helix-turn-helix transcriptional regulator [Parafannyhessea umbonata]|uniref:helix-turn-helix domain-containing protein n=1 Tax=Parafannyhessea umbonata TaxID=604330 RepID=UPI0026EABB35|nr:helix-turn-helix transcriptional regulator [Parafannyhessea umbonata]MDD6566434.1 helix-turn-helix transcriptional regulator [Parafannyhessea umbonata]
MLMLKEFREASGLKIAQVAERAGVPYETYRKWEKGDSNPNWEQLCRVADVLHCSLDDLTGRRETLTQEERALLARWRTLSSQGKATVLAVMDSFQEDSISYEDTAQSGVSRSA